MPKLSPANNCSCDLTTPTEAALAKAWCNGLYNYSNHPCGWSVLSFFLSLIFLSPAPATSYCFLITLPGTVGGIPVLRPGQSITFTESQTVIFGFFAFNLQCNAYVLRTRTDQSEPQVALLSTPQNPGSIAATTTDPRSFILCPGETYWGQTVFVFNSDSNIKGNRTFSLELRAQPAVKPIISPCTVPLELQGGSHLCINSGRPYSFSSLLTKTLLRFVVPVEKVCGMLSRIFKKIEFFRYPCMDHNKPACETIFQ